MCWMLLLFPIAASTAPEGVEEVVRLEAWPALEREQERAVDRELQRLRKARTPAMGEEAAAALLEIGAGAAPELLRALGKERDEKARARILSVLDGVTGAAHTRLLAAEFGGPEPHVRIYCLQRAAAFPDPSVRGAAESALERSRAEGSKAGPEERYVAALCTASSGSAAGLDLLYDAAAKEGWDGRARALRTALEAVRGPGAARAVEETLRAAAGDRARVVAGLRLLAGCGDPGSAAVARAHLESEDHGIRLAAINAMRGIVDGDPPLEKLPVFEAIERAEAWKRMR